MLFRSQRVLGQVDALNASLGSANERLNLANLRLATVRHDIVENRHALRVARHNLASSQRTIAHRLVTLYTTPQASTLELILGAKSLDDVLSQLDSAKRVSALDTQVIRQVLVLKETVKKRAHTLAVERKQVARLVAMRRQQQRAIEVRLGERRRLLSSLNDEIAKIVHQQEVARMLSLQRARQLAGEQGAGTEFGTQALTPEGAAFVSPSRYGGVVSIALRYQGIPYVWGGSSPSGFDCSGFVMYSYAQVGVSLPHSSYAMMNEGVYVPRDQLQAGDLVVFDGGGHIGIYIGGGLFVHSPHTGTVVQVSSINSDWYASHYVEARRIL